MNDVFTPQNAQAYVTTGPLTGISSGPGASSFSPVTHPDAAGALNGVGKWIGDSVNGLNESFGNTLNGIGQTLSSAVTGTSRDEPPKNGDEELSKSGDVMTQQYTDEQNALGNKQWAKNQQYRAIGAYNMPVLTQQSADITTNPLNQTDTKAPGASSTTLDPEGVTAETKSTSTFVRPSEGYAQGEKLGSGSEGTVYKVKNMPGYVMKVHENPGGLLGAEGKVAERRKAAAGRGCD